MLDDNVDETIMELTKDIDKKRKITKVIKMQEKGVPREEIIKETGHTSVASLSKFMKRNGYRSENKIYIKEDDARRLDEGQNNIRNTKSDDTQSSVRDVENREVEILESKSDNNQNNIRNIESDNSQIAVRDINGIEVREISDKSMNDILEIIKRKDDILKMLEWFDKIEEPVIVPNELKIEINASTDKKDRKSIFFNPELWDRFENFCKKNKQFKKHDIINQALYELLERVDNEE